MRLTDLDPRWISFDERLVGITFRCPHCKTTRLTVYFEPTSFRRQVSQMHEVLGDVHSDWVPSRTDFAWERIGDTFEELTIIPSVDASRSGHWHGHVKKGEVT